MPESQASPPAEMTVPTRINRRGPTLVTSLAVTWAPTAMRTVWGKKASPACSGL